MSTTTNMLDKLDQEKSFKTQLIIGLGLLITTTFLFYWAGVKQEGLIAGDMVALVLGAAYMIFMDRTKIKFTNRLLSKLAAHPTPVCAASCASQAA